MKIILKPVEKEGEDSLRVFRGGSGRFDAGDARTSDRYTNFPFSRGDGLGFRLTRSTK
jgi:hypothetical protein